MTRTLIPTEQDTHWHATTPTTPYRISGCGRPYLIHPAQEATQ